MCLEIRNKIQDRKTDRRLREMEGKKLIEQDPKNNDQNMH